MKLPVTPSMVAKKLPFPYRAPSTPGGVQPLPPKRRLGADFDTEWARRYPARVVRAAWLEGVVRPSMALVASPRVRGRDRLAQLDGPVIFAANHHSHVDTPLLLSCIPDTWRHKIVVGAAADYFFGSHLSGSFAALGLGAIPIERAKVGRKSADQARELIDDGWSLLLFPEGGRSPDGWGQPFRGGAAYLALRCDVPVVPIHLEGTGRILRKDSNRIHPGSTTVTFGTPLTAAEGEDARRFAARIEREVAILSDEVTTDWWQARQRAHAGETPSLTGPQSGSWRRVWALGDTSAGGRRRRTRWPDLRR